MTTTTHSLQLAQLDARIKSVWRRSQTAHLVAGILAFCCWAIPLFLVSVAVDWMTFMPVAGRFVMLAILLVVSFHRAWRCGWRHLRAFDATRIALMIEQRHGGLESLLVSAVQLRDAEAGRGASSAMREQTCRLAEQAAPTLQPDKVVPYQHLRHPAVIALALGLVIAGFAGMNHQFLSAGLTRIFAPWIAAAYPTNTKLDLGEEDLVVKEGDSARIAIGVSGIVPDKAKLYLSTGEGSPRELELDIADGRCQYTIASASRDFSYRIKAGDARSDWHQVKVITAPRIESVRVTLAFPAYLERADETVEALTLTAPEGTNVHWHLTLDRPISEAVLERDGEQPMPLAVTDDGRQLVIEEAVTASRGYRFSWVEKEHGFEFTSPRYYLQVASDQPPRIELTSPETNLSALLGRELNLAVRAQDDHGIGATTIRYRVNLRPEKTVSLAEPVDNGGEQKLDWDYRKVLPNLAIGDAVSIAVEVADKYPGPDGPHATRSETRRITFLSRDDYLAQIERRKERLLSRVRTTYRQQRAAHELVRQLDPRDDSFLQTCQLEAIRQEMLREQLKDIAGEVQALLDDLKANNIADAVEGDALVRVRDGLESIAEQQVAKAAALLRNQTGAAANGNIAELDAAPAARVVNQAARRLAGLVLQRGIDSAREVFARESHMLAREQALLRLLTIKAKNREEAEALTARQEELAAWTDQLIDSLQEGMRYDRRPVAVLGLTRRIKELRGSGAEDKMRTAAALLRDGKTTEAAAVQAKITIPLLAAEFAMRTGAEYAAIVKFRDLLDSLLDTQRKLRTACETMSPNEFAKRSADLATSQAKLRDEFIPALLPPLPAPRARLFDKTLPQQPPVEGLRQAAETSIAETLTQLEKGDRKAAIDRQSETEKILADLIEILDRSAVEVGLRTQGLSSLVSTAVERTSVIEDFETRQIALLEQTEETALDEKNATPLVEPQQFLCEEIADFGNELSEDETDRDVLPLVNRLREAAAALKKATGALQENQPEDALEHQEQAADLLAAARELAKAQADRLTLLQELYTFQRAVGIANDWMVDIVAEQTDLVVQTESAKPENCAALLPAMKNLRQCFTDIAPVLDLVAGRLDAGTPLLFAGTDMEDAIFAIESKDLLEAVDAQQVTAQSLAEVQTLVKAVQIQTGYLAEIVEFLHSTQADAASLGFRQAQLRQKVTGANGKPPTARIAEQAALQAEAESYGRLLERATGVTTYVDAGNRMREAHKLMNDGNADGAVAQMATAETTLNANAEELYLIITMLHGLPSIEVTSASPAELVRLIDVLAIAADQRNLSRRTEAAADSTLAKLAAEQQKFKDALAKALQTDPPHPMLVAAHENLTAAANAFESSDRAAVRLGQRAADDALRHFIIEQALILETAKAAASSSDEPVLTENETDDLYESTANFVSDFVSGEAPKDQRTEWEVLGNRNRAALNQNFARELPLEYRATLKDYYERVAK